MQSKDWWGMINVFVEVYANNGIAVWTAGGQSIGRYPSIISPIFEESRNELAGCCCCLLLLCFSSCVVRVEQVKLFTMTSIFHKRNKGHHPVQISRLLTGRQVLQVAKFSSSCLRTLHGQIFEAAVTYRCCCITIICLLASWGRSRGPRPPSRQLVARSSPTASAPSVSVSKGVSNVHPSSRIPPRPMPVQVVQSSTAGAVKGRHSKSARMERAAFVPSADAAFALLVAP